MATIPLAKGGSIRTFSQAPAGFNPLSASDRQLAVFGFPRRPTENPHLLARWQKALSRPVVPDTTEISTAATPAN
jgi:hypothetical protein